MMSYILTLLFCLCTAVRLTAQFNYYKLSTEFKSGPARYYGDVNGAIPKLQFAASLDYHLNPYLYAMVELESGTLVGGDSIRDPHRRFFRNNYHSVSLGLKVYLSWIQSTSGFFNRRMRGGPYIGLGAGLMHNNLSEIKRKTLNAAGKPYIFPGENTSTGLVFPLSAGLSTFIRDKWGYPRVGINLNYSVNLSPDDGMDGYSDPPVLFRNRSPDLYQEVSIGLRYYFGMVGFYW